MENISFNNLLSKLTKSEKEFYENGNLGFFSQNMTDSDVTIYEILPTTMGNHWWLASKISLNEGIQEYTPRPMAQSRLEQLSFFKDFLNDKNLKPCKVDSVSLDYYDKKISSPDKYNLTNIYVIQSIIGGPVKIGKSNDIDHRLSTFQMGSPFELKVIKLYENVSHKVEKHLHKHFNKYRLHGEWFSEDILNHIDDIIEKEIC
jgi:hypothetical protein